MLQYSTKQASIRKNTIYNAARTLATVVFPLFTFPYLNHVLQPENVGKVSFGASVVSYFSLIASLGTTTYAIRECSAVRDDKEKLSFIASQIFSINVITTIMAYAVLFIVLISVDKLRNYRSLIVIQSMIIMTTTLGADWLNSAMEDFKYIAIRSIIFQFIGLVLVFSFVRQSEDYIKYSVISATTSGAANVLNIWYRRKFCHIKMIWNFRSGIDWKRHVPPIVTLFVMILSQQVLNNLDVTMLGFMKGDRSVGLYSTALKIYSIITQLIISITWVVLPRVSVFFSKKDYGAINNLIRHVTAFTVCVGAPFFMVLFALADDILITIAGSEYVDASMCLRILAVSMIFMFLINIFGNLVLLPQGKEGTYTVAWISAMVFNMIANTIIIPAFGYNGAAVTTALANMIVVTVSILNMNKEIHFGEMKSLLLPPFVGAVIVAAICIGFGMCSFTPVITIVISLFASTIVYVLILWIFRYSILIMIIDGGVRVVSDLIIKHKGE